MIEKGADGQILSVNVCNCLKGIFAICVLVHHLYQHSGLFRNTVAGSCLQAAGYLSVACFLLLSGYGLFASYQRKGKAYVASFPKRKILPFYCIILLFTVFYCLARGFLFGQKISTEYLLRSFTFGGTVISNGWYLQLQLLLYLLYFATFYAIKNSKLQLLLIFSECLFICICMSSFGYVSTWYESIFAFPAGMLWCSQENRIKKLFKKKTVSLICALLEFVIFSIAFIGSQLMNHAIFALILKMISAVVFTILVATVIKLIPVQNRFTDFLGKHSIEIYAVQGIFLTLFHSEIIDLTNPYVYIIAVVISTFCASIILHPITKKIYSLARNH